MSVIIGSGYYKTRTILQRRIKEGTANLIETESVDYACYFCEKKIQGKVHIYRELQKKAGGETETTYFIGERCFRRSKIYEYCDGLESSFN